MSSFSFLNGTPLASGTPMPGVQNTSSNQYGSGYPAPAQSIPMPGASSTPTGVQIPFGGMSAPGVVPQQSIPTSSANPDPVTGGNSTSPQLTTQWSQYIGQGQSEVPPVDASLQATLMNYLQGQVGQGVTPYNLSAALPTGGTSGAGQVQSPLDPVTQQLMNFFTTGQSSNPALNSLQNLATTGDPIDQTPAWQAMVNAAQQQIAQGTGDVREQMAFTGNLPGSAGATAIDNYQQQAQLGLTSQLINAQTQAQQQAVQNQLAASDVLEGSAQQLGSTLYGYDQSAITNLMNEYFQTTPQANPLNQEIFSGATTYAPTFGKSSTSGLIGQLVSSAPSLLGDAASGIAAGTAAAGAGAGGIGAILAGLAAL